ncbi:ABATE domain-containing protein [Streptomyces sp. NPDC000070]|uniref:ABATE domain-containing protein n=1 Tax=Streptomyces sp. NPDC000070 TaxID=3154240 RepID=UPI0033229354
MEEPVIEQPAPPSAPGEEEHLALALVNSAIALPGGHTVDLLGTPAQTNHWLTRRGLAPVDAGMREMCATQLRSLREQIRIAVRRPSRRPARPPGRRDSRQRSDDPGPHGPAAAVGRQDRPLPHRPPPHHRDRQPCPGHLAADAADAADLLTSLDADRLTACGSPPCTRYLLRHGRRHWCSTRCGDRACAARAYARRSTSR